MNIIGAIPPVGRSLPAIQGIPVGRPEVSTDVQGLQETWQVSVALLVSTAPKHHKTKSTWGAQHQYLLCRETSPWRTTTQSQVAHPWGQ